MATILIIMNERHSYPTDEAAAAAIRDLVAGYDDVSASEVLRDVQRQAAKSAADGRRADIMITHLP